MIDDDDMRFLRELRTEIREQPTLARADRCRRAGLWVVRQLVRRRAVDSWSCDGFEAVTDVDAFSCRDAVNRIYDDIEEARGEAEARAWLAERGLPPAGPDGEIDVDEEMAVGVIEVDGKAAGYRLIPYVEEREIVDGALFLTLRECEAHIGRNRSLYRSPEPYRMTASDSPRLERLMGILMDADLSDEVRSADL